LLYYISIFVCKILNSLKVLNQLLSLNKENSSKSISRNLLSSSLYLINSRINLIKIFLLSLLIIEKEFFAKY